MTYKTHVSCLQKSLLWNAPAGGYRTGLPVNEETMTPLSWIFVPQESHDLAQFSKKFIAFYKKNEKSNIWLGIILLLPLN